MVKLRCAATKLVGERNDNVIMNMSVAIKSGHKADVDSRVYSRSVMLAASNSVNDGNREVIRAKISSLLKRGVGRFKGAHLAHPAAADTLKEVHGLVKYSS